ncbi:hypothetical protein BMETH_387_2 [methanotrophic bacterial endosymbiont of Bathymodiolus sp.]|nr:hypothetical protein BMETH_387_2 [methanotrophic bacterial endosymbiont of Bathymodiolus sp.]
MGVFPFPTFLSASKSGLPHARGGVSPTSAGVVTADESSPRPWGCFPIP